MAQATHQHGDERISQGSDCACGFAPRMVASGRQKHPMKWEHKTLHSADGMSPGDHGQGSQALAAWILSNGLRRSAGTAGPRRMRRTWLCLASLLWGRPYEMHAAAAVPFIPCQQEWSDQARRKLNARLLRANRAGLDWTGLVRRAECTEKATGESKGRLEDGERSYTNGPTPP